MRQMLPSTAPLLWARVSPLVYRGVVAADAAGEGVQARQVVEVDGVDPAGQVLAVAAGHQLGECGDVAGGGVQLRAAAFELA